MTKRLANPKPRGGARPGVAGLPAKPTVLATPKRLLVSLPYAERFTVSLRNGSGFVEWSFDGVQVMAPDGLNLFRLALPGGKQLELGLEAE